MPTSAKGIFLFALTALVTVVVGLALYNRLAARAPALARVVAGPGAMKSA